MVGLIRKFSCVFFMSALVLVCLLMPAELKAGVPCCKNGEISTCPDPGNGQSYDLSGCQGGISPVDPVVPVNPGLEIGGEVFLDECTSGQAQYKPNGDCGTSKRTCCSSGLWSKWDGECKTCEEKTPCASDADCCNGNKCVDTKPNGGILEFGKDYHVCGKKCEASMPTCFLSGGTCKYNCTCDASTGQWADCVKQQVCNVGYKTVNLANGDVCCDLKDCGSTDKYGHVSICHCNSSSGGSGHWAYQTSDYSCNSVGINNKGKGPEEACGACNPSNNGAHCVTGDPQGYFTCTLYICEGNIKY